jgi:hypothetical protein
MSTRGETVAAGLTPGASMLEQLPGTWWVLPSRRGEDTEPGGMLLLGGPRAGDPEVLIQVQFALPPGGGRDLTEPMARWLAELIASELCGTVMRADLSDEEVLEVNAQLSRLLVTPRANE